MHKHFTESMRSVLAELLQLNLSKEEIAKRLGVNRSSVYRELRRNTGPIGYVPEEAQGRAHARRMFCGRKRKMDDAATNQYVCRRLKTRWSPDQIAGRSQLDFRRAASRQLSRQTIYDWISRQPRELRKLWRACLRFGKPRRKRPENAGRLPGAVSIEGRPQIVNSRRRFGDWEGDTIVGAGRRGGLVSLVERKSGYTFLARVRDLRADTVRTASEKRLLTLPEHLRHSLTFDNGKEFAEHAALASATGMAIFFAQPYCAWQRGSNENTNGLVRQYLPKGSDLAAERHRVVASIETSLNDRPRKRLDYRTPREVLTQNCARHGVAFET
jgi:IS30 family transposase